MERTLGKVAAGRLIEVADCRAGWAKLQLASEAAAGELGDRSTTQGSSREIKPQTSD